MLPTRTATAPVVDDAGVTFRLADPTGRLGGVRLVHELGPADGLDFTWQEGIWQLHRPLPAVDRMEYLLEIIEHNNRHTTITDPGNPARARGAFGDKSVLRFPGYREPAWLGLPDVPASVQPLDLDTGTDLSITGLLWSPDGLAAGVQAPQLVVHDGPEYATLGSFTRYLGAMIATGRLPPLRAALLAPGDRNEWYSANPAYAKALCMGLVPALDRLAPATVRIGAGVSLGALAMLHAHRSYPATFDGLLLQSGSFFTAKLDPQESGFVGFWPVSRFVSAVARAPGDRHPVPTAMTCGVAEENFANNCAMARQLARLSYPVDLREVRDAHNYTAWRDALDPACTDLIASLVGAHAA